MKPVHGETHRGKQKMNALESEFDYYLAHQVELVEKFDGKFVVIKNKKVLGAFETLGDAYFETTKTELPGTFLIQEVSEGTEKYTQTFHSRVSF